MKEVMTVISMVFPFLHLAGDWWNDVSITGTANPQIPLVGQPVTLSCNVRGCTSSSFQVHLTKWEDSKNQTLYMHRSSQKPNKSKTEKRDKEGPHMENGAVMFNEYKNWLLQVTLPQVQLASSGQYVCGVQCDDTYKEAILEVIVEDVINVAAPGAAIFSCLLSASHDPSYLKLQWKKINPGKSHTVMYYLYQATCPAFCPKDLFGERWTCSNRSNPRIWFRKKYEHRIDIPRGNLFGRWNASLKLNNVQAEDAGKYQCSVESNMLHKVVIFNLSVQAPSVIATANPETILIGHPVTLSCQVKNCKSSNLHVHLYKREGSRNQTLYMHHSTKQRNDQEGSREERNENHVHARNGTPIIKEYKNGVLLVILPKVQQASGGLYVCAVQCDDVYKEAVMEVIIKELESTEKWTWLYYRITCLILAFLVVATWCFAKRKAQLEHDETIKQLNIKNEQIKNLHAEVEELKKLQPEVAWRRACEDAVTITLDVDSAHPCISISDDKRSFTHKEEILRVSSDPQHFDGIVAILGCEGFSSGNHYWAVDLGSSSDWDVGVVRKSIKRKGNVTLSPKEGFWVLGFTGRDYFAKTDPWTRITVQKKPSKIGIHLSLQENKVTFFNVTDMSILYEFKACEFSEDIYPFFKNGDKGKTLQLKFN